MKYCSYDVETTGLHVYKGDSMFAYCIGHENGHVEVHRMGSHSSFQRLQDFFSDTSIAKICHNTKFDMKFTLHAGIKIPKETEWHDTMIMSQLLRNLAPSHALDYLCWELGKYPRDLDADVRNMGKVYRGYQNIPSSLMTKYQVADGERTMLLFQLFYPQICKDTKLKNDYQNEMQLIMVAHEMEEYGINISKKHYHDLIEWLQRELESIQDALLHQFGELINLNSEDQVARLLYKVLGFPILEYTPSKKPSTGKDVLLKLRERYKHPVLDLIFKQRSYTKGIAIIRGYREFADEEWIIHPNLGTNRAKTGRLTSSDPNLMNVSREGVLKNPFPVPSRRVFKARKGNILYLVDYAGIELRLGIEVSNSLKMIELMKKGENPHVIAARIFYGERFKSKAENKDLYGAAKNAHFALMYGAGKQQLADTLNIGLPEALISYFNYENTFPEIAHLANNIGKRITEDGYVTTPFGRKLYVYKSKSYAGLNYLIQGTAAGILKRAMVRISKYIKKNWESYINLVLPIHDELVISFSRDLLSESNHILKEISKIMITMPEIKVPLAVEWKMTTSTWDVAKEIDPWGHHV